MYYDTNGKKNKDSSERDSKVLIQKRQKIDIDVDKHREHKWQWIPSTYHIVTNKPILSDSGKGVLVRTCIITSKTSKNHQNNILSFLMNMILHVTETIYHKIISGLFIKL